MFSMADFCSIIFIPLSSTLSSVVWKTIHFLWSWNGIWIFIGLSAWTIVESLTRNGKLHYNSKNGFSPAFNIFVGSGVYWGTQSLLLILLEKIFGESVYCLIWPYPVHLVIFIFTGRFLIATGFWVYIKKPGTRKSHRRCRRKKYKYL